MPIDTAQFWVCFLLGFPAVHAAEVNVIVYVIQKVKSPLSCAFSLESSSQYTSLAEMLYTPQCSDRILSVWLEITGIKSNLFAYRKCLNVCLF